MHRAAPTGSKVCARREHERRQELHRARVKNMKPLVDTTEPTVAHFDHVRINLKKEQLLEERYTEIDRENRILLSKMSTIVKTAEGTPEKPRRPPGPVSLNQDSRKKELLRITRENGAILKRIQQAQPVYNHVIWEDDSRKNKTYLQNCAEYPLVLRSARGKRGGAATSELLPLDGNESPMRAPASNSQTPRRQELPFEAPPGPEQKNVLKESTRIGEVYYLVEMSTDGFSLNISAYDGEAGRTLELVLKEKAHRRAYRECNGDYSAMAKLLRVDGNRLFFEESALSQPAQVPHPPQLSHPSPAQASQLSHHNSHSSPSPRRGAPPPPESLDADAMIIGRDIRSAGDVNTEVNLDSRGDPYVRLRGFTPSSGRPSPTPTH